MESVSVLDIHNKRK